MLWFLVSSTLLMSLTAMMPRGMGTWRRRAMEAAVLLIVLLPVMRGGLESLGMKHPLLGLSLGSAGEEPSQGQSWLMVWGAGGLLGLALLARQLAGVWRWRKNSKQVPRDLARSIAAQLHLPVTVVEKRFRLCLEIETPVVALGLPAMVLLPDTWQDWPARLQRSAMRHEWHHVLNGDAWWFCGMRLFCAALWFHPLAWHLALRWADECEHLADCAAVGADDPADYADDLLGLAGRAYAGAHPRQMAPGFLGPRDSHLQRRVRSLLNGSGTAARRWISCTALTLLLLAAGCCAWSGVRSASAEPQALIQEVRMRLNADAFPAD